MSQASCRRVSTKRFQTIPLSLCQPVSARRFQVDVSPGFQTNTSQAGAGLLLARCWLPANGFQRRVAIEGFDNPVHQQVSAALFTFKMTRHRLGTVSNQHARSFPLLLALCRPASPKRLQMVSKSHVVRRCLLGFHMPLARCRPTTGVCFGSKSALALALQLPTPLSFLPTHPPTYLPTYQATSQPTQPNNAPTHPPNQPTKHKTRTNQGREGKGRHGNKEPDKRRQGKTRETVH